MSIMNQSMIVGRVGHRERADTVLTVIGGGERYFNMQEVPYPHKIYWSEAEWHTVLVDVCPSSPLRTDDSSSWILAPIELRFGRGRGYGRRTAVQVGQIRKRRDDQWWALQKQLSGQQSRIGSAIGKRWEIIISDSGSRMVVTALLFMNTDRWLFYLVCVIIYNKIYYRWPSQAESRSVGCGRRRW